MSTTIPIQELDTSTNPPSDRAIHAVVTLLWPYSSSTRSCALLLSERDFRLRARGGQIRVKFSGPVARAVAERRLGIGDEVVLELGSGEWVRDEVGAAVRVPGKSVGELQFGRGASLRVKRDGVDEVEIKVAEDAVDEVEQEQEEVQIQATPVKRASPVTNFRSSIGGPPGSAAIYSSPAYMRKAAKFSYLDGISRLFEDEWNNQDLPRKKARTSFGEVRAWKVVDKTPSPEPEGLPSDANIQVDEEMTEADVVEETNGNKAVMDDLIVDGPDDISQVPTVESRPVSASPSPTPLPQEPTLVSPTKATSSYSSPLDLLAASALKDQETVSPQATSLALTLPKLQLPSASPTPQPNQSEVAVSQILDPVTPRLLPLSSTTLPSTTPQISPLATKDTFAAHADAGHVEDVENKPRDVEVPDSHVDEEFTASEPAALATDGHSSQGQLALTESESTAELIAPVTATAEVVLNEIEGTDPPGPWRPDDLAEEDAFSDEEPDKVMSSYELDGEMMYEDDAEDVFDADTLDGGEPSDDDTNEDFEMHQLPGEGQQWPEESTTEKDSDVEDQPMLQDQMESDVATQSQTSVNEPRISQQPGFAPASTLLRAAETPARNTVPAAAIEDPSMVTPFKQPAFTVAHVLPSTEVATPAAKSADTPRTTPQSARDKVMKRTFHSLFGIKGTPSPEKEDAVKHSVGLIAEGDKVGKFDLLASKPDALKVEQIQDRVDVDEDGVQPTQSAEVDQVDMAMQDQADLQDQGHTFETDQSSLVVKEELGQAEEDGFAVASQEVPSAAEQQITELINLDSESDEEPSTEEMAVDQATEEPVVSESSPRKQALAQTNELVSSALEENDDTEPDTTPTQDASVDVVMPEAVLADAVEASSVPDVTEQRHALSDDSPEQGIFNGEDADMLQEQEPSGIPYPELDNFIPDSFERTVSPPLASSPRLEEKDVSPIELKRDDQTVPEPVQLSDDDSEDAVEPASNADLQMDDDETPLVVPESLKPSVPLDGQDARSPSVVSEKTITEVDDEENGVVEVDDVDMLDVRQRERESSQASFESQVVQDSVQQREGESPEASFESQVAPDSLDATNTGVHENSSRPTSRDTVEDFSPVVLNAHQREAEPSQASFESQVVHDTMDIHNNGVHEISSRPTSRDTVEDFSPVALGTFSQRISDVVSESQAAETLRELESDGENMLDQVPLDVPEDPATSASISETLALMGEDINTPSRAAKHTTTIDFEPTPLRRVNYEHVETDQSTREQMLTPRATFDDNKEEDVGMADSAEMMQQRSPERREDLSESGMRPLRRPSYAALDGTSEVDDEQAKVTESADLTLPMSPSATQSQQAEPEAQLSHVNVAQAVVQPAPLTLTSQFDPSAQSLADIHATDAQDQTSNMSQIQQQRQEQEEDQGQASMLPPQQPLPPKTPGRKSLRSRLSNVPDVISAWFSPKRSSLALQESEKPTGVEETKGSAADAITDAPTPKKHASGLSTAHAYFTSLASLDQHLNLPSQQASSIDLLAVVTDFAKEPERAKGGPRDYYTVCKITDPSMPNSSPVRVEVFRPWKAVLPAADVGDVILLRGFVVKSKKRQAYLLSTDTSAWCVWRFAEHSNDNSRAVANEAGKPAWARRMSHSEVREEVKGPPVEYGLAEKHEARKLRDWWNETHDDSQGGASDEIAGKELSEEPDAVES